MLVKTRLFWSTETEAPLRLQRLSEMQNQHKTVGNEASRNVHLQRGHHQSEMRVLHQSESWILIRCTSALLNLTQLVSLHKFCRLAKLLTNKFFLSEQLNCEIMQDVRS